MNLTISDFKKNSIDLVNNYNIVLLYLPKCVRSKIMINDLKNSKLKYGLVDIENNISLARNICIGLDTNLITTPTLLIYKDRSFLYSAKNLIEMYKFNSNFKYADLNANIDQN